MLESTNILWYIGNQVIKSTKTTIKFANQGKRNHLYDFLKEYRMVVSRFVDLLWNEKDIRLLLPKLFTDQVKPYTWLSARALQCAGKQASGVVRGTQKKQRQRVWRYNKLIDEGKTKQARKLKKYIDAAQITKPDINRVEPELDSRFVKQDWPNFTTTLSTQLLKLWLVKSVIVRPFSKPKATE